MVPLQSFPPSSRPPSTEMANASAALVAPLPVMLTMNVQGTPFLVQVPANVPVLPDIIINEKATLCTVVPLA